jgi:hypothetical protein
MVEFYSLIPSVAESMPIIPAKEYQYRWYDRAIQGFRERRQTHPDAVSVARCPGIIDVNCQGWIQRTYQDIWVRTEPGNKRVLFFKESIAQSQLAHGNKMSDYVSFHEAAALADFRGGHDYAMDTLLKLQSPWRVRVPVGYSLLAMPIPYPDDQRFTAAHGTLRGDNWLNVQMFWHPMSGSTEFIPKGTPVQQYILIKDDQIEHCVRSYNETDQF